MSDFQIPDLSHINSVMADIAEQKRIREEHLAGKYDASELFEHLLNRIKVFQNTVDDDHEVGVKLANFGIAASIHVRGIAFKDPNLIEFVGVLEGGEQVVLVQHISQLNFLLVAVPPVKDEEPYRIGFQANK